LESAVLGKGKNCRYNKEFTLFIGVKGYLYGVLKLSGRKL
jgi:hypothetical protein